MVAGLELTKITLKPSAFSALQACAQNNQTHKLGLLLVGPAPMIKTDLISVLFLA